MCLRVVQIRRGIKQTNPEAEDCASLRVVQIRRGIKRIEFAGEEYVSLRVVQIRRGIKLEIGGDTTGLV